MLDRRTAEKTSAAPATARKTSARGNEKVASPNKTIATPQMITATMMPRPTWRIRVATPEIAAPSTDPAAGAALSRPTPIGPAWKTSRARTGKRACGMPKIIALRSIANVDRMIRRPRTNRRPSAMAARPGRAPAVTGGIGRSAISAAMNTANVTTSRM